MDEQSSAFNIRNAGNLSNMPVVATQVCFKLSYSDIQVQRKQRGRRGYVQWCYSWLLATEWRLMRCLCLLLNWKLKVPNILYMHIPKKNSHTQVSLRPEILKTTNHRSLAKEDRLTIYKTKSLSPLSIIQYFTW